MRARKETGGEEDSLIKQVLSVISASGAPVPSSRPCVVRRRPLNEETGGNIDENTESEPVVKRPEIPKGFQPCGVGFASFVLR